MHIDPIFTYSGSEIALKVCRNKQRFKLNRSPLWLTRTACLKTNKTILIHSGQARPMIITNTCMSKQVSNVCKTFCGITCSFEADKKWIKISKVSKILIFKKCSNSLGLQKAFLKRSYYQIVSIVSGLMCYAKSCYSETSTLVDFTWEIVVQ